MKITKTRLKRIIKEELDRELTEQKILSELHNLCSTVGGLLLEDKVGDARDKFNSSLKGALQDVEWEPLFKALGKPKEMGKGKQAHSYRVGGHAAAAGGSVDEVIGALMHDFVERGGNLDKLVRKGFITDTQKDMILALSSTEKNVSEYAGDNEPLHHMQQVFAKMDNEGLKNTLAMVKAGDRVDNVNRRVWDPDRKGPVTKKSYLKKSTDLFDFLLNGGEVKYLEGKKTVTVTVPPLQDTTRVKTVLNRLEPEAKQALANYAPDVYADFGWAGEAATA